MYIEKVPQHNVKKYARGNRRSIYENAYNAVRDLNCPGAVRITLDSPKLHFGGLLQQYFRKDRSLRYKISAHRQDEDGLVWGIIKTYRNGRKKVTSAGN